jgi:hypothetical protein
MEGAVKHGWLVLCCAQGGKDQLGASIRRTYVLRKVDVRPVLVT